MDITNLLLPMPFDAVNGQILSIVRSGERWYTSIQSADDETPNFSSPLGRRHATLRVCPSINGSVELSCTEIPEEIVREAIDAPIDGRYHDAESDRRERHRSVLWRMVRGGLGAGHLCQG